MPYVPMEPPEGNVEALVGRVKTLRPDAVFSALVGLSNRRFLAAYADAGIDPADVPIASHNIPRPTWWPYDERNVPVISPRRLNFSNIARDEGFIFLCAGIFVVQAVVQVSAWRTDSVRVRPLERAGNRS
jgi:hypothetical protein